MSRDIIDLAMMIDQWGDIPRQAWAKTTEVYGELVFKAFRSAVEMACDPIHLRDCLRKMHMDESLVEHIPAVLKCSLRRVVDNPDGNRMP